MATNPLDLLNDTLDAMIERDVFYAPSDDEDFLMAEIQEEQRDLKIMDECRDIAAGRGRAHPTAEHIRVLLAIIDAETLRSCSSETQLDLPF